MSGAHVFLLSLSSFPTIYFAPAGKKQSPKKYEVSILLFLMLCKEVKSIQVFKSYSSLFGVGGGTVSCYPGNTPDGTCGSVVLCAAGPGEKPACSHLGLLPWHLNPP